MPLARQAYVLQPAVPRFWRLRLDPSFPASLMSKALKPPNGGAKEFHRGLRVLQEDLRHLVPQINSNENATIAGTGQQKFESYDVLEKTAAIVFEQVSHDK